MHTIKTLLEDGGNPTSLRVGLLRELIPRANASFGAFHSLMVDGEGVLRVTEAFAIGSVRAEEILRGMEGVAYSRYMDSPADLVESASVFDRFASCQKEDLPQAFISQTWEPMGAHSGLFMNAQKQGRFLGQVALFRADDAPRYTEADVGPLRAFQSLVHAVLLSAVSLSETNRGQSGVLLLRRDGSLSMSGGQVDAWARPAFRSELRTVVESMPSEPSTSVDHFVDGTCVRLLNLSGQGDGVLVTLVPVAPWLIPAILQLPPTTRRVTAMAARGATALEIAEKLHRSPDTVRTHLKRAYAALGIASRSELASLVHGSLLPPKQSAD